MAGEKEIWSKAVALTLLERAAPAALFRFVLLLVAEIRSSRSILKPPARPSRGPRRTARSTCRVLPPGAGKNRFP
jgi:hypothetical protein